MSLSHAVAGWDVLHGGWDVPPPLGHPIMVGCSSFGGMIPPWWYVHPWWDVHPLVGHPSPGRTSPGLTHLDVLLAVGLVVQQQLALQQEAFAAFVADLHAAVRDIHVFLQVPAIVKDPGALLARVVLLFLQLHLLA